MSESPVFSPSVREYATNCANVLGHHGFDYLHRKEYRNASLATLDAALQLRTFPMLGMLPRELQDMIWDFAAANQCRDQAEVSGAMRLSSDDPTNTVVEILPQPCHRPSPLLSACRASRARYLDLSKTLEFVMSREHRGRACCVRATQRHVIAPGGARVHFGEEHFGCHPGVATPANVLSALRAPHGAAGAAGARPLQLLNLNLNLNRQGLDPARLAHVSLHANLAYTAAATGAVGPSAVCAILGACTRADLTWHVPVAFRCPRRRPSPPPTPPVPAAWFARWAPGRMADYLFHLLELWAAKTGDGDGPAQSGFWATHRELHLGQLYDCESARVLADVVFRKRVRLLNRVFFLGNKSSRKVRGEGSGYDEQLVAEIILDKAAEYPIFHLGGTRRRGAAICAAQSQFWGYRSHGRPYAGGCCHESHGFDGLRL